MPFCLNWIGYDLPYQSGLINKLMIQYANFWNYVVQRKLSYVQSAANSRLILSNERGS